MWDGPQSEEELKALQQGMASCPNRLKQRYGSSWRDSGPFDWTGCKWVEVIPGKVSGVPLLRGTRMPADSVLNQYEHGASARELAANFLLDLQAVTAVLRSALAAGVPPNGTEDLEAIWRELETDPRRARLKTPLVDWNGCVWVDSKPDRLGGTPVLVGDRHLRGWRGRGLRPRPSGTGDRSGGGRRGRTRSQPSGLCRQTAQSCCSLKILLDNNMNPRLQRLLKGAHEVQHAYHLGWEQLQNGDLLRSAETAGFDLLITIDKSMFYQQNNSKRRISLMILPATDWDWLRRAHQRIVSAVECATPGGYIVLDIRHSNDIP